MDKLCQFFLNEEYELGTQLCISQNISLEFLAEYLLESHIPKKWNKHLSNSNYKFWNYQSGKKFLGDNSRIECLMGQFYTELNVRRKGRRNYIASIFLFKYGKSHFYSTSGNWLLKFLIKNFAFTLNKPSRSFYKRFIKEYTQTWNYCKEQLIIELEPFFK